MSATQPMQPNYGDQGAFVAATAASVAGTLKKGTMQAVVNIKGTVWVHVYIGNGVRAATANDPAYPPGTQQILTKSADDADFSFIAPDGVGSSVQVFGATGW